MGVRVGTSGWSYDDWHGPVYPRDLPSGGRLRFYTTLLPTTEVNSTFYRDPAPRVVDGWVKATRSLPRFEFSVKAPRALTQEALKRETPETCAAIAKAWADLVVKPLAEADRLGAILLQLSPGVFPNKPTLERLDAVLSTLDPHPVAVEPRNKTWHVEERLVPPALDLLDAHGAAPVIVDGPSFPTFFEGKAPHAYARFHGRNHDVWLKDKPEDNPDDPRMNRYDYLYSDDELRPWSNRLASLAKEKPIVRVYFNNHPGGNAVFNAQAMETLLEGQRTPVERAVSPQRRLFG